MKEKWSNPELQIHREIALWAARCASRSIPIFEIEMPGDERPRKAINSLHSWIRGEIPMTECRTAAFAAHAAARECIALGKPAAVAAARAAGQAAAVAHMFNHSPHAATYSATAIGLNGNGEEARQTEREWQWENLDPKLRKIGFPKGL